MAIDWSVFESKYWKPEPGKQYAVVLANWRVEQKTFKEQENNPKWCLTFEVLKVDGVEVIPAREWSTTSFRAVKELRPIIEGAERRGVIAISVILKRDEENNYSILELPAGVNYG